MTKPVRIRHVEPLEPFKLRLEFTDGTRKEVDITAFLRGPIFEPIKASVGFFRSVRVDPRMGTIVWSNGADIDPDVLYHGLTPAWMESQQFSGSEART
jgi:hypothetical protein